MLGRKTYTQEEADNARSAVERQLAVHRTLTKDVPGGSTDQNGASALEDFDGGSSTPWRSRSAAASSTGCGC